MNSHSHSRRSVDGTRQGRRAVVTRASSERSTLGIAPSKSSTSASMEGRFDILTAGPAESINIRPFGDEPAKTAYFGTYGESVLVNNQYRALARQSSTVRSRCRDHFPRP